MLLFPKIIVFLWISIEYIYQVKADNTENKLTISDIARGIYLYYIKTKIITIFSTNRFDP